jgi:uncharacterized membrane protein YdjX (TVP38/TMEM64 family)
MAAERGDAPGTRWGRAGGWLFIALIAGVLATGYALGWTERLSFEELARHSSELRAWVHEHLHLALLLFVCGYTFAATVPCPATVFHLAAGALLGLWSGYALVIVAYNLAAVVAFLLSRHLVGEFVQRRWAGRLRSVNRGIERDGAYYVLTLRLIPAFPFFLVNGLMGLTQLSLRTFASMTVLGMLPVSLVYVYTGTQLEKIRSPADILSPGVLLAFLAVGLTPLVLRLLIPRTRQPANVEGGADGSHASREGSSSLPSEPSQQVAPHGRATPSR